MRFRSWHFQQKKRYSSFLKSVFILQKICFEVQSIENVQDYH